LTDPPVNPLIFNPFIQAYNPGPLPAGNFFPPHFVKAKNKKNFAGGLFPQFSEQALREAIESKGLPIF